MVGAGLAPTNTGKSVPSLGKQAQQYNQTRLEHRQQTTRDSKIIANLLHPQHRLGFGVWKTANGEMHVCGKGIGIDIRDQVVDTLFQAIKNATPATNKFRQPADAFFGRGLTKTFYCLWSGAWVPALQLR